MPGGPHLAIASPQKIDAAPRISDRGAVEVLVRRHVDVRVSRYHDPKIDGWDYEEHDFNYAW